MSAWYECKIAYQKTLENGKTAKISEIYLVDAVSFTDAETRMYKEFGDTLGEFTLQSVKKPRISELVHNEEAFKWYRVKVNITTLDEKSGKESKSNQIIIASAANAKLAYEAVDQLFSDSVSDYEIVEIVHTLIVDIFPYFEEGTGATLRPLKEVVAEQVEA
jgi:hypothetical protein